MNLEQLNIILQEGEGFNIEFKQSVPSKLRELSEEICAFANAAGGILLIVVKIIILFVVLRLIIPYAPVFGMQ